MPCPLRHLKRGQLTGLLFVAVLHGAGIYGLWSHHIIQALACPERVAPEYPRLSMRMNEQGKVLLRVELGEEGYVAKAEVKNSSGYQPLDDAALNTVRKWRCNPPLRNGVTVGEALIMMAVGLAVAIPAVLAYNSFTRRNRIWLAQLDNYAHDLYALVTVGDRKL